jgi:hypothetical protein
MKSDQKRKLVEEALERLGSDPLYMDGLDDAIIGIAQRSNNPHVVAYSEAQILENLMSWGMSHEEAKEYYYFNIVGAWLGQETPIIVTELSSL